MQNPEIREITPLLKLTRYSYVTYRQMIGRSADIKKALYMKYGIKLLKQIPLKKRQDIYIQEIKNYIKVHNNIPSIKEFEAYTGLCLRSVCTNFSELVYKATGTVNHIFGPRWENKEKLIKKTIILRMQKRYNEYPDKKELTRRKFIYKICGVAEKTLKKYFGSTEKALKAAKIPIYPKGFNRRMYNDQQIIQSLQKAAKYYNHTPSMTEYDNFPQRIMKSCSILCRFGKWNNAIIAAELEPGYIFHHFTDKEILKNLVTASLYYNCAVTYSQYEKFPQKICNNKTIINRFGSWNKALEAAGLK